MIKLKEMLPSVRNFPIMGVGWIPWDVIAPHERQAELNHGGQSLERLSQRGGLSPQEAVAVIEDRPWRKMADDEAMARLRDLVAAAANKKS